jgi:hypothetical protein
MLDQKAATFSATVKGVIAALGTTNPARITEAVIDRLYPRTKAAAEDEGAFTFFQRGVTSGVISVNKRPAEARQQQHMADLYPELFPYISALTRASYYVPETEEYVSIGELIDCPSLLDAARRYLRQHGIDTIKEAERLDDLYQAVTRKGDA